MKGRSQNIWVLILLLLAGVVLGGFLAQLLSGYPALSWLGYGKSFGLTSPLVLDLGVLTLQFAFTDVLPSPVFWVSSLLFLFIAKFKQIQPSVSGKFHGKGGFFLSFFAWKFSCFS